MAWNAAYRLMIAACASAGGYFAYQTHVKPAAPQPERVEVESREERLQRALGILQQPVAPEAEQPALPAVEAAPDAPVRIGAQRDEVLATMGTPRHGAASSGTWLYPDYALVFDNDRVAGIVERGRALSPVSPSEPDVPAIEVARFAGNAPQMFSGGGRSTAAMTGRSRRSAARGQEALRPDSRYRLGHQTRSRLAQSPMRYNRARSRSQILHNPLGTFSYGWVNMSPNQQYTQARRSGSLGDFGNPRLSGRFNSSQQTRTRLDRTLQYHFTAPDRRSSFNPAGSSTTSTGTVR